MTSQQLLSAFTDIKGAYIEDTRAYLGYGGEAGAPHRKEGKPARKLARTLLLAAIITALLTAAAYATGWFGLGGLKTGSSFAASGLARISLQGLADTVEARAAAEWQDYLAAENATLHDYDEAVAVQTAEQYGSYGVSNQAQLDKLFELCGKYDLVCLGTTDLPESERAFCESAGVGRLVRDNGGCVNEYRSAYVYSSGTFHMSGRLYPADSAYPVDYQLTRAQKGVLDYVSIAVADVNGFDEWDYQTADGTLLHLANTPQGAARKQSFIFMDTDTAFITVNFLHDTYADYLGDGVIDGVGDEHMYVDLSNAEVETFAECFDWAAFADPTRGMDSDFSPKRAYTAVDTAALIEAADKTADFSVAEGDGDNALYYLKLAYNGAIEPYIAGFRLVDYLLLPGSERCMGWLCFAGVAKQPLDWEYTEQNGERIYCRGIDLAALPGGEWSVDASMDMRPAKLQDNLDPGERALGRVGAPLSDLTGASLFVRATGEWYSISDPAALETLGMTLRFNPIPGGRTQSAVWDPILLDYADGTTTLAYTLASGENLLYIYGTTQSCMSGVSIFELFGVPLAPKGYSERDGVVTTRIVPPEETQIAAIEYDYIKGGECIARRVTVEQGETSETSERRFEYDAQGRLSRDVTTDPDGTLTRETVYTYGENGQLAAKYTDYINAWEKEYYYYDELDRLIRVENFDNERPDAAFYTRYTYAEDGSSTIEQGY